MPYYEFMWFAKEWIEYIDAKIKRNQEEQAEYEREKARARGQSNKLNKTGFTTPKFPKK